MKSLEEILAADPDTAAAGEAFDRAMSEMPRGLPSETIRQIYADLTPVPRPNGKLYRPRKVPSVEQYADRHDCTGAVVLRTHDVELAVALAVNLIREYDLDPANAYTTWWRVVPFDPDGYFDSAWLHDPARGVPCVVIPYE